MSRTVQVYAETFGGIQIAFHLLPTLTQCSLNKRHVTYISKAKSIMRILISQ